MLTATPAPSKVHSTISSLKRNKAIGPNGFSEAFFHVAWNIIGPDIINATQHFFTLGRHLWASNTYMLTLIPKVKSPSNFTHFRPISLLCFTHKIIFKILASRLSTILPSIISHHQVAFPKNRSIHHHAMLVHKLFQKLNSRIKGSAACLKLDITKAFDQVNWDFLFESLLFFGFFDRWIHLIKECICTSIGSVLINKLSYGFFILGCGLHQGDPLSPYLFILAEEIPSLNLVKLQMNDRILLVSTNQFHVCLLLYANDIVIFSKAIPSSAKAIRSILQTYQLIVGQTFNLQKAICF